MPTVRAYAISQLPQFPGNSANRDGNSANRDGNPQIVEENEIKQTDCLSLGKDILQMELILAKHQIT